MGTWNVSDAKHRENKAKKKQRQREENWLKRERIEGVVVAMGSTQMTDCVEKGRCRRKEGKEEMSGWLSSASHSPAMDREGDKEKIYKQSAETGPGPGLCISLFPRYNTLPPSHSAFHEKVME